MVKVHGTMPTGSCGTPSSSSYLCNTTWGQDVGFNDDMPTGSCVYHFPANGRWWTGCETVAAAQVMYYYSFPSSFVWSSMNPDGGTPTSEAARLMKAIVDHISVIYICNSSTDFGTGAHTDAVRNALVNIFGYNSAAAFQDFRSNETDVLNDISIYHRPVIMDGSASSTEDGHAWVCDGVRQYNNCHSTINEFHMNWGWYGAADAFYNDYGLIPENTSYNFNFDPHVIVHIYH
jgi:hypothetical protein